MHSVPIVAGCLLLSIVCPIWANNAPFWFEHFTYLEIDFYMNCSHNISSNQSRTTTWFFPNGELIKSDERFQLNGDSLHIKKVNEKDAGRYICRIRMLKDTIRQVHTLNIGGPMYHSINEKYFLNFVIAGASSAILCFLVLAICLIYKFRYKEPKFTRLSSGHFDSEISFDTKL